MDLTHNPFKGMSKPEKIAVVAGTTGIAGYLVYSHHKKTGSWNPWSSSTSASTGASDTTIDPVTGLAYSQDSAIDPITGLAYLAEATQYGSVATAEASVSAYGASTASGSGIGVNPASPPSTSSVNTTVGTNVYTSNSAWAQAATAGLTDVGYPATDVATALGDYLTGTPVTAAQAQLINTAIAEYGPAPSGGLQIILAPVTTPSPTPVPTPVSGGTFPLPSGHSDTPYDTSVDLGWSAVTGADSYHYQVLSANGANVVDSSTTATSAKVPGLKSKTAYKWRIAVHATSTKASSPWSPEYSFTTK
jgi:hypothetical protein